MEGLKAILFGIVEGITEWLPISSTGHLILLSECLALRVGADMGEAFVDAFRELFDVLIQLSAMGAVLLRFFYRINPFSRRKTTLERRSTYRLLGLLLISGVPAAAVGVLLDRILLSSTGKDLDGWLFHSEVVAAMLILYGVFFLIPERKNEQGTTVEGMAWKHALAIGGFQALAVIPGTSRSGATILGGMLCGLSRTASAEYSFLLALPTMTGAGLLKVLKFLGFLSEHRLLMPTEGYLVLMVGMAVSFFVSLLVIDFLLEFVKRHSFLPFGIYRILLGIAVLTVLR